ncbi:glycosyltransferase [Actibacterium sp. 188UL27-1]|uniref:glycosyltransferase n=1 Tax=Actibacterium sp. 188UL27-1 TaxID=2786961 RepID=UPI00195D9C31|nr:glycosyltransferase [Actibacterium sp. 188UL27-1]MBM7069931.1 glycosyltransferase [Actibacterium sp. 188UL27-1]
MADSLPGVTLVIDPRFSGGTSSAVATEIRVMSSFCRLRVAAVSSAMFSGNTAHPAIIDACEATGVTMTWDAPTIADQIVVLHNPSFLKFDQHFASRIVADQLFVVCHENFLRPGGGEGFAVRHCLDLIQSASLCRTRSLAPISAWNRKTIYDWAETIGNLPGWAIAHEDWTNICSFDLQDPVVHPRDRRGRLSRPGFEKFPDLETLHQIFPDTCEAVRILGADSLMADDVPSHWDLIPFRAEPVTAFLSTIDFFIYYTNTRWRESFGRVIAEAIAAGKLVITDPDTAQIFGPGVLGAQPFEVNDLVAKHIAAPALYASRVEMAQAGLSRFSASAFKERFNRTIAGPPAFDRKPGSENEDIYALL